ncbi:hypothetical protein GZH53_17520 [Flavihumibacter sp. R14]|nr:hypothetical protein [Flavihumibacter soli]
MKVPGAVILLLFVLFSASCNKEQPKGFKSLPFFREVIGTQFTEVRRAFDNGLSFDKQGFQLEPDWRVKFLSDDSVRLYNPLEDQSYNFHVHYDHDSVINMGRVWLRVKNVSRDSLKLQLLQIEGRNVSAERSNIYMTFYSDQYISGLKTSAEQLRKPNVKDSLFVRNKIKQGGNRPAHAFGAREPVRLIPKSPRIKVEKLALEKDPAGAQALSDEYLSPEYKVVITPAYKDFNYSFTATVDTNGRLYFGKSTVYLMPEFEESQNRVMKGIMDVYLQNLLEIRPGKTLGMEHPSLITLHVKGVK